MRILLADDDRVGARLTARVIETFGMTVRTVFDGTEAVEAFRAEPFDAVLLDLQMPTMNGDIAAQQIRALASQLSRRVVLLALSGALGDGSPSHGDFDVWLTKPILPHQLHAALLAATKG